MQDPYATTSVASNPFSGAPTLLFLALLVFIIVANWKLFQKAGKPGWASIVPIYSTLVLLQIIGRPWWWILLLFIPFINLIFAIILALDLAKVFGRGPVFGVIGLLFFPYVAYPMLAFGSAKYTRPTTAS